MDHDFDKEIDTLLRKAHHSEPVFVGDFAGSRHLDADEISAFAENAMPEKSRALYTAHFADCDRCRKILSNLLVLNAEAAPAAASSPSAITIAERAIPWYRQLFLFPNLAYVMGGLVLIFGGFLAFTIVRNSSVSDVAMSPMPDAAATKGGPNFENNEPSFAANAANMAANANSNIAGGIPMASTNSTSSGDATLGQRGPLAEDEVRHEGQNYAIDGLNAQPPAVTSPPPPVAAAAPKDVALADRDDAAKEKAEAKVMKNAPVEQSKSDVTALKQQQYPSSGASGPMRNETQYNRQLENLDRAREADKKKARAAATGTEEAGSGRRVVGGRTFEKKQGVWYDVAYSGRPTINVQRGTAEFSRLDGGLRSIANSLSGTIVVVWGAKAYRIQ